MTRAQLFIRRHGRAILFTALDALSFTIIIALGVLLYVIG